MMAERRRTLRLGMMVIAGLVGTAGAVAAQTAPPAAEPAPAEATEFRVRPGDVLRIQVWPDTLLGGRYPIEDTGLIHLPALGAVRAGGRTLAELRTELRQRYGEALKAPIVTVTPIFRVSVIGAVQRPGLYEADPTRSVFDVISEAGGFRDDADAGDVRLIRDGRVYEINADDALEAGTTSMALGLRSGDRIVVPRQRFDFGMRDVLFVLQSVSLLLTLIN